MAVKATTPRLVHIWLASLTVVIFLGGCYGSGVGLGGGRGDTDDDDATNDDDDATNDDDDATNDDDDATNDDDDDDDDDGAAPFSITSVTPNDGDTRGGDQVQIFFSGSLEETTDSELTVLFGSYIAQSPIIAGDRIIVDAPPGCEAGDVDVSISTVDDGSSTLLNGYEYEHWADSDEVSAVVGVYYAEAPLAGTTSASAEAGFFEPDDSPPLTHLPPLGSCTPNLIPPDNNRNYFSMGSSVTMSGGGAFPLTFNSLDETYVNGNIPPAFAGPSTSFTISGATDPDGCTPNLSNVVQAPGPLFVTEPNPLLDINNTPCWWMFDQSGSPNPVGGLVQWGAPSSSQQGQNVFINVVNSNSGTGLLCHAQDNGSFIVSATDLLYLDATGGAHTISVTRYLSLESDDERTGATRYGVFANTVTGLLWVAQLGPGC